MFFLLHDYEPKTVTNLHLNKQSIRPRPGHLCWRLFDKQFNKVVPFVELPSGSQAFPEVGRRTPSYLPAAPMPGQCCLYGSEPSKTCLETLNP